MALLHFLGRAAWDAEKVRDELIRYVATHVLSPGAGVTVIGDKTGFLKKGKHSAGVQRQYSRTTGRIENGQISVFLTLAGIKGRYLICCELYLPKEWYKDEEMRVFQKK